MVHYVMASVPMTVIAASAWYGVSRNGEVTTVSFAWWTPLLALLVGIAVAAYGFRLYQKRSHYYRYGPVLMVLGPVLIILTIPMLLLNKTVVDNQRFEFADGMWWNIHRYEVRFDDVRSARLETQEKQTRNTTYLERRKGDRVLYLRSAAPNSGAGGAVFFLGGRPRGRRLACTSILRADLGCDNS